MDRKARLPSNLTVALVMCQRSLTKLQLISEQPVPAPGNPDVARPGKARTTKDAPYLSGRLPKRSGTNAESKVPRDVALDGRGLQDREPTETTFSLYAHFYPKVKAEFEKQRNRPLDEQDPKRLISLWRMMDREYSRFIGRTGTPQLVTHEDQLTQLLVECIGFTVEDAAEWCEAKPAWVRTQRVLQGRAVATGIVVIRNPEHERIREMSNNGASQNTIAAEIGCSQVEVGRVLKGERG